MIRLVESRAHTFPGRRSWPRVTQVVAIAVLFGGLAYLGTRGKLEAGRRADLDLILAVRDELQAALDAERSVTGPLWPSASRPTSRSREVADWAVQLEGRIEKFSATHEPATETEDLDLRLARAALAVAKMRFPDALAAVDGRQPPLPDPEGRDRWPEVLRVRADSLHDARNPAAALVEYRALALRLPRDLAIAERIAECLHALGQAEQALDAYSDLARRLQSRGERRAKELDPRSAAYDLEKANRIRAWLATRGRSG